MNAGIVVMVVLHVCDEATGDDDADTQHEACHAESDPETPPCW
jgi:hypothetical protein